MHLHWHLAECIQDYGPIYGFWLFPFERYNGILGNFPTNKRSTAEQLMKPFIYEMEYMQLPMPDLFKEHFQSLILSTQDPNQLSQQKIPGDQFLQCISFPTVSKYSALETSDLLKLQEVYSHIYSLEESNSSQPKCVIPRSIKVYKTLSFYNQRLGSFSNPSSSNSAFSMAKWCDESDCIDTSSVLRPGHVLYYFMLSHPKEEHVFAAVYWFEEHLDSSLQAKLKPLSV